MTIDWRPLFVPSESLLGLVVRGSIMYLLLFAALRIMGRRHMGSLNMMDLLLMVLVADAAQNGMAGEYTSITEGLVLCGTLLAWNYFLDWLTFTFPLIEHLLEPSPLPIIRNGKLIRKNLVAELLTRDEILSQLREHDIFDVAEVKLAFVESDGALSIKRFDNDKSKTAPGKKKSPLR